MSAPREPQPLGGRRWTEAVSRAYGLTLDELETPNARFVFGTRKPFLGSPSVVTAPYGTDGGVERTGPVLDASDIERLEAFRAERNAGMLLIKTRGPLPADAPALRIDSGYVTFVLDLEGGSERVWEHRLAGSVRTDTRKGMRLKADTRIGGAELFDDFLHVMRQCWRDLGTPTHSAAFYRALLEAWNGEARIVNVYHDRQPIATAMLLPVGSTIHHPFSCTLNAYKPTAANTALTWRIVEWACEAGYRYFDMGRSPVDSGPDRFKRKWGGTRLPLHYGYLMDPSRPLPNLDSPMVRRAVAAWKRLPLPLANVLGPHFIKSAL